MSTKFILTTVAALTILSIAVLIIQAFRDRRVLLQFPFLNGAIVKLVLIGMATSLMAWVWGLYDATSCWTAFNICVLAGLIYANIVYWKAYFPLRIETRIGEKTLSIPTTHYEDVRPGVSCRQYIFGGLPLNAMEKDLIAITKGYDPERWDAFFFDIGRDADHEVPSMAVPDFPCHRYRGRRQDYFLTRGAAEIIPSEPDLTPEDPFPVPPGVKHHFRRRRHCIGVTFIEKPRPGIWDRLTSFFTINP